MPYDQLISRLQVTTGLSESDRNLLANMPSTVRTFEDGECLFREGDIATRCSVLLSGFLFRQKIAGTRNQMLGFHVPGDLPDLQTLHLPLMDHDISSSGPATVAFVTHATLKDMLANSRSLTHIFWRETLVDAAIHREWIANLGARDAIVRVAHLICELAARLEVVGLVQQNAFHIPFTQKDMAEACGISTVHINRTLQDLRGRGLISWQAKTITLLNRRELEETADFLPNYLHEHDAKLAAHLTIR